ncbi:protein of unknown function DUF542, ScdA-like protein [Rubrobacter xylanophilus DSM 9941]|uniref:Hemerythrin-like domain-containing protein n=1 Tax=Rubrobacter xylanophilus (strain DSM 9941 / JCM 11954 / NBRC 16129 / PRD-1) TaxID=266117 RepID=Q1AWS4_RUBXD|nr:iron-sulfur cluster repair di-iron protein [Rubrobacter xylanophilus]ABG04154.1 protein of unknown function DUF542, ScdA-like protein [Rubrobacter xylanophilus DSM 9941]
MISAERRVDELVVERPARSRVFERFGIDYCCGGGVPLREACEVAGVEPEVVISELERLDFGPEEGPAVAEMGVEEMVDHIVRVHHDYLREELPRLGAMVEKVARVHGGSHPELYELCEVFAELRGELEEHTEKEERVLFPACIELASGRRPAALGYVRALVSSLVSEHVESGEGLRSIREITRGYRVPEDACNTYRAMLDGLAELERDTHEHVFKENSLLFPRVVAAEEALERR